MGKLLRWLKTFNLFREYLREAGAHWQEVLGGASLPFLIWGIWFIVANPPVWINWSAVLLALLIAGYFVWRADHVRLMPKFEVRDYCFQDTPTQDTTGKPTGTSTWVQLLPKCLTDADVKACQGHLRRILRWSNRNNCWEETPLNETVELHWSHEDMYAAPMTLHPGIERRLNLFYVHSSNCIITPKVMPMPLRASYIFGNLSLDEVNAFLFDVKITAQDCADVDVTVRVQISNDPFRPFIEVMDHAAGQNIGSIPSSHIS
ncbi:MAG TPA: hypothetical protein VFE08_01455 [Candidatus Sulfotelmatobacter sp.]|jgi:hypothetical protein|nr:hypothetical protein [Candidatus Sulfotelmatobacter sp.]